MPEMGGRDLLRRLEELGSKVPVILTSGYAIKKDEEDIKHDGFAGIIAKPFTMVEMMSTIRSVLDKHS